MSFKNKTLTNKLQYAVSFALLITLSAPTYASQHQSGHKPSSKPSHVTHKPGNTHRPVTVTHKPSHKPNNRPNHRPNHKPVVIVHKPSHHSYNRHRLPKAAKFMMIAGISYALIDNVYYKRNNDTYDYVQPPIVVTNQVGANQGTVVNAVPQNAQTVVIAGTTYYVYNGDWYAPIADTNQFVIVAPQV